MSNQLRRWFDVTIRCPGLWVRVDEWMLQTTGDTDSLGTLGTSGRGSRTQHEARGPKCGERLDSVAYLLVIHLCLHESRRHHADFAGGSPHSPALRELRRGEQLGSLASFLARYPRPRERRRGAMG